MLILGIKEKGRRHYWALVVSTLLKRPRVFPLSISLAIQGFHFRQVAKKILKTPIIVPSIDIGTAEAQNKGKLSAASFPAAKSAGSTQPN
jgi:hypothetical protein